MFILQSMLFKCNEELKKKFKNTFTFSNNETNKLILMLRNGAYPYYG